MLGPLLKAAIWPAAACALGAILAGSFVAGYHVGYSAAWEEIAGRDRFTFEAVQEYLQHHPHP